MSRLTLALETSDDSVRLDLALLTALQKQGILISRANLKTLFQEKGVLYRNSPIQASSKLAPGVHEVTLLNLDQLMTTLSSNAAPAPEGCFLPVVYEDEDILVLHKTSGVPSVPHNSSETNTAVNAALARTPELSQVGRKGLEPGLLHRLDTGTSGLLLFAKTQNEFERLSKAWRDHQVKKHYRALVELSSPLPKLPLRIDLPLAHDARSSKKMIALQKDSKRAIRGKPLPAVTHIRSAQPFRREGNNSDLLADLEIQIETGVMHQIRCHLSSMGYPILGDSVYKGAPSDRLWLHAWRLELSLKSGVILRLEAKLPTNFT